MTESKLETHPFRQAWEFHEHSRSDQYRCSLKSPPDNGSDYSSQRAFAYGMLVSFSLPSVILVYMLLLFPVQTYSK